MLWNACGEKNANWDYANKNIVRDLSDFKY